MAAAWAAFPGPRGPKPLRCLRAVIRANTVHPSLQHPSQGWDRPGQRVPKSRPSMLTVCICAWRVFRLQLWLEERSILIYIHGEASRKTGLGGLCDGSAACSHSRVSLVGFFVLFCFSWEQTNIFFPFGLGK